MNHTANGTADAAGPWHLRAWEDMLSSVGSVLGDVVFLVAITIGSIIVARALRLGYDKMRRKAPTAGSILMGKSFVLFFVVAMVSIALNQAYGVNLVSVIATLGIVSLALGFGLQNTVANLAAGLTLSVDRPFQVGDRIRVGTTWGDVVSIGLRSTRIRTTSGELVAVPNALLDTQEVWNNTHATQGELRLELPFEISYGSSIQLAEALALRVARRHDRVLSYPEPMVQVRAFRPDGVELELRAWIDDARHRAKVVDRLLRGMKAEFDSEGVQFPFPQRTVSKLEDMAKPAPTPDFLHESEEQPIILACTRGAGGAAAMANGVVDFARRLDARLVVLHTRPIGMAFEQGDASKALNHYMAVAEKHSIKVKGRAEVGEFAKVLAKVAKEEGAKLVIFGQTKTGRVGWSRAEIAAAVRSCPAPVLPLQTHLALSDDFVARWSAKIRPEPEPDVAPDLPIKKPKD